MQLGLCKKVMHCETASTLETLIKPLVGTLRKWPCTQNMCQEFSEIMIHVLKVKAAWKGSNRQIKQGKMGIQQQLQTQLFTHLCMSGVIDYGQYILHLVSWMICRVNPASCSHWRWGPWPFQDRRPSNQKLEIKKKSNKLKLCFVWRAASVFLESLQYKATTLWSLHFIFGYMMNKYTTLKTWQTIFHQNHCDFVSWENLS